MTAGQVRRRHERLGVRVLEDVCHAVRGVFGINRHVGGSRLQDPEECAVRLYRPREHHCDNRPASNAPSAQMAGEPVRAALELGVRRPFSAKDHGHGLRPLVRLRFEDRMEDLNICK